MARFGLVLRAALFFLSNLKRTDGLYNSYVASAKFARYNPVTMTVTLKPDLEVELAARAKAQGLTTDEFVNRVLEKLMAHEKSAAQLSHEERAEILLEWTAKHAVGGAPLSDYAESRESIYKQREDAQL
jgi:hypothetical protein